MEGNCAFFGGRRLPTSIGRSVSLTPIKAAEGFSKQHGLLDRIEPGSAKHGSLTVDETGSCRGEGPTRQ